MSVTIDGPEGYEYQYLATTYLILSFLKHGNLKSAVIDALNKEDLQLTLEYPLGTQKKIEVQFKKKKGILTLKQFAAYFTHFNSDSENVNVLSKLTSGEIDAYYLITNTSIDSFAGKLHIQADPLKFQKYHGNRPSKGDLKTLADAIKLQHKKPGGKHSPRNIFVQVQAKTLESDTSGFEKILTNTFVVDRMDVELLIHYMEMLLSTTRIPVTRQRNLILELLELVRKFRGTDNNILRTFTNLLQSTVSNLPDVNEDYIKPTFEDGMLNTLKGNSILLLTGVTMCGKTQIALNLAKRLVDEDQTIIYYSTGDIEEAKRVLIDPVNEARVCYLEDPTELSTNITAIAGFKKLESLVQQLPKNKGRYLIVTTPSGSLIQVEGNSHKRFHWQNLTIKDRKFLKEIWSKIVGKFNGAISEKVEALVVHALETDHIDDLIQPGQLDYLGRNIRSLISETETSVRLLANVGAKDIEKVILEMGDRKCIDSAIVLGITASTLSGPNQEDLQYIFNTEPDYLPGIVKQEVGSLGSTLLQERPETVYRLNTYAQLTPLDDTILSAYERFSDLGYLKKLFAESRFEHPIFQDGCRRILAVNNASRFLRIVQYLQKAVGCLNERAAINAIKSLDISAGAVADQPDKLEKISSIAFTGLKSTFVNVRDLSLLFLIDQFDKLKVDDRKIVMEAVIQRRFGKDTYRWQEGKAFIPDVKYMEAGGKRNYQSRARIQKGWDKYTTKKPVLDAEKALQLLKRVFVLTKGTNSRVNLSIEDLRLFLSYEESFIQERASYLIAASCKDSDVELMKELFSTSSPFIRYELIHGMFRSWPYLSQANKEEMLLQIKNAYNNVFVALSGMDFFTQFSAGHTSYTFDWWYDIEAIAIPDMWHLWAELMPFLLKHLPYEVFINKDRFLSTLLEEKITPVQKLKIASAALIWLPGHLKSDSPINLGEYILIFIDSFFEKISGSQRSSLLTDILKIEDTFFKAAFLRRILPRWEKLNAKEKTCLKDFTVNASHFLQSVILSCQDLPQDLSNSLVRGVVLDFTNPAQLIKTVGRKRLKECLNILYLDRTYMELCNDNKEEWSAVLRHLTHHPKDPCFMVAVYRMIEDHTFDLGSKSAWGDIPMRLTKIMQLHNPKINTLVFDFLLESICGNIHSDSSALFHIFFDNLSLIEKEYFGNRTAEYIESISQRKNIDKLPADIVDTYILPKLYAAHLVKSMVNPVLELSEEGKKSFAFLINTLLSMNEIRTWNTYQLCRNWVSAHKNYFKDEELKIIEDFSNAFFETERIQREQTTLKNMDYFEDWLKAKN